MKSLDSRIIKGLVALAALAYTVYLFAHGFIWSGIFMLLLAALLVLLVFRSVRIMMVFLRMRKQDMAGSRKWLARINPAHLWKGQKGYYYFLQASANADKQSLAQSEKDFRQALSHGLRYDHDKAMVYLNLAVITANKRKKREAITLINEAKKYDSKGLMKEQIKQVMQMINRL